MFTITHTDSHTRARIGLLSTRHGKVETPCFLPVATKAAVKHATAEDLTSLGVQALISNSMVLALTYGDERLASFGGIHKLMGFNGVVFTDSGGFQMIRESFHLKTLDSGVYFKDPFNNKTLLITPELVMQTQARIGSDVAMVLDDHNDSEQTEEHHRLAIKRTYDWAKRCLTAKADPNQQVWGIVQGGTYPHLRKESAELITSLPFDGFALGGLAIGEPPAVMKEIISYAAPLLPCEKPRYVMGLGEPGQLLDAISLGIDFFDSTYPTQTARHNTLFTRRGKIDIEKASYLENFGPIDKDCECFVCKKLSCSYLRYLVKMEEPIAMRYKTYHNLWFVQQLLRDARKAIADGKFLAFKEEFMRGWMKSGR